MYSVNAYWPPSLLLKCYLVSNIPTLDYCNIPLVRRPVSTSIPIYSIFFLIVIMIFFENLNQIPHIPTESSPMVSNTYEIQTPNHSLKDLSTSLTSPSTFPPHYAQPYFCGPFFLFPPGLSLVACVWTHVPLSFTCLVCSHHSSLISNTTCLDMPFLTVLYSLSLPITSLCVIFSKVPIAIWNNPIILFAHL